VAPGDGEEDRSALLERFRQSGLSIDREGQFWHEGEPVRHQGLRDALFRWLDRLPMPDGRHILRLDEKRFVYIDVADTPLVATSLRWVEQEALLGLSDGSEERLDTDTLTVDGAGVLRCRVRDGRLEARLGNSAAATLGERIENGAAGPVLRVRGGDTIIGRR
jgi:uncharacterized protein